MSFTNEAKKVVERLLESGRKSEAIEYVQQAFRVSFDDAGKLVEAVELEMTGTISGEDTTESVQDQPVDEIIANVTQYISSGRKVEAVKYVKTKLNLGLREALMWVENVQREIDPTFTPLTISRAGCMPMVFKMLSALFGFLGFGFLAGAGFLYYLQQDAIENGTRIIGKVVELREDSDGSNTYAPVIEYQWEGEEKLYYSNFYSSPPEFSEGDQVAIFINPNDPNDIVVDAFVDRWLLVIIFGSFGAVFILLTIIFSVMRKRSAKAMAGA
jgi:ribosomal protein L7/L12